MPWKPPTHTQRTRGRTDADLEYERRRRADPELRQAQRIRNSAAEGQADPKCLRKTFNSLLLRAEVDLLDVMLLMRHTPPGSMSLTLGTYGDEKALLARKRRAVARMVGWIERERSKTKAAS